MAMTALEIYKHLPKKNCGECGVPTCLAFAMQLSSLKSQVEKCPYVSQDAKQVLCASATPPIKPIRIGSGEMEIEIGDEVVMFRHEKTFYHPTALSALVHDEMPQEEIWKRLAEFNCMSWERIGQVLKLDMVAVKSKTGEPETFESVVKTVCRKIKLPLILMSEDPDVIKAGIGAIPSSRPLLHCATESNWEAMVKIAKEHKCPIAVRGGSLERISDLAEKIKTTGFYDIVLDLGSTDSVKTLENLTIARRLAIRKNHRSLGYPALLVLGGDDYTDALQGALGIMKYASAIVFENAQAWKMLPLLTLRQNIFTDPQKPIQVKPGLYEIGKPCPDSPLYFTTNFSLTYFTVKSDIEKSKVPSYLLVVEAEGLSVLTAYAAGKLTAEGVLDHLQKFEVKSKVSHNRLIIPGMVARMSVKLRELTGMEIVVGPNDSSGIPPFVKTLK